MSAETPIVNAAQPLMSREEAAHLTSSESFGITATNWLPSNITIMLNGVQALKITEEMAQGKFEISDAMILELGKRNWQFAAAITALMNMDPQTKVGEFRQAINTLLTEFTNELHKYLAEQIDPKWAAAQAAKANGAD